MAEKEKTYARIVSGIILLLCTCVVAFGVNLNNRMWNEEMETEKGKIKDAYTAKKLDEISADVKLLLRQRPVSSLRDREVSGEG